MAAARWYYVDGGDRIGPVESVEIDRQIAEGNVTEATLVWREGLEEWEQARHYFSFPDPVHASEPPPVGPPPVGPGQYSPRRQFTPVDPPAPRAPPDIGSDGLYVGAPSRSFGGAIGACFRNYITFSGRASRSEYWYFVLFVFLVSIALSVLDVALFGSGFDDDVSPLSSLFSLAVLLPMLAVTWRRLHDTDRSGWWIGGYVLVGMGLGFFIGFVAATSGSLEQIAAAGAFLGLAMLAYYIMLIVFFCQRGTPGPNRFG